MSKPIVIIGDTMKFKIVLTAAREYKITKKELDDIYGGLDSFEEALALDIENAKDDPCLFFEMEDTEINVKGEIF